ncbi:MAG: aldehyde dehydrogenase family protein [Planctomycetota bacterium]
MTATDGQNLLEGEARPSRGAGRFEVRSALAPAEIVGSWPRSDRRDAEPARALLEAFAARAGRERTARRRPLLVEAAARLEGGEAAEVAASIGLEVGELAVHRRGLAQGLRDLAARVPPAPAPGVALVLPHWSELFAGALYGVARELLRGRAVLLLADPRVPALADRVVRSLLEAGLPPGAIALLHGASDEAVEWLVGSGVASVTADGARSRIARLRRWCEAAGVAEPRLAALRAAAWEVPPDRPVEAAARTAIELAFGRARTLFGQRGGQVGRIYCPERSHSAFTAALLASLEESQAAAEPLPLIDRAMVERTREAWGRGLDRGATLIFGGRAPAGEEGREGARRVLPTVFTNAEAALPDRGGADPLPVLYLYRSRARAGARGVPGAGLPRVGPGRSGR